MSPVQCTHKDCVKLARWRVGFRVWAKGYTKANSRPMEGFILQYIVCDEHRSGIDVKDLLLPEGRARIVAANRMIGRAEPDFDTAEVAFQDLLADAPASATHH